MKDLKATEDEWRLTPEEIRSVEGFENASDEDIELIQSTFSLLTLAFYDVYLMEQNQIPLPNK